MPLARISWLVTVGICLIAALLLLLEGYYGYSTFSELLQDAERNGLVKLRKDERSGSWVVT